MLPVDVIGSYIICATPRSGSNWLCEILSSLGCAGRPFEHLWVPEGMEPEPLAVRWPRILETGRGENGVFGIKLMYYQAKLLEEALPEVVGMPGAPLKRVLDMMLSDSKYIYLTRRDHLRQAVSHARAMQSGQWRSMDQARSEPHYDATTIAAAAAFLEEDEANWEAFFTRNQIAPYRLTYEELTAELQETVRRLLVFLGHDAASPPPLPPTHHRRQADEQTEEWLRRYRSDFE